MHSERECLARRIGRHSLPSFVVVAGGAEASQRYRRLMAVLVTPGNFRVSGRWGRLRMNFSKKEKEESGGKEGNYPTWFA